MNRKRQEMDCLKKLLDVVMHNLGTIITIYNKQFGVILGDLVCYR